MYCERCNCLVFREKCPGCGRTDFRVPQYDDFCFLTEPEPLWVQALKDLLGDNGVEYVTRNVHGAGMIEARVRKCINYIRMRGLVPHLIANSNGYFVATSIAQVEKYMKSLDQRATAIWAMRSALNAQLSGKLFI